MLSEAVDDYLKIIFTLTHSHATASTGDIARALGLSAASVTAMVQRLSREEPPLVIYAKSRGVRLTEAGKRRALEIIRHHRLLETFLHDKLGIPYDKVHEEAEKLEHYISETLEDAIADSLGDPLLDLHGSPIPRKTGEMPTVELHTLLDLDPQETVTMARLLAKNADLRVYLEGKGFHAGASIRLVAIEPFGGPVLLEVNGQSHAISQEVARQVSVARAIG